MNVFGHSSCWRGLLIHALVAHVLSHCFAAQVTNDNCDPGLQPAGGKEIGYASRGDRCEGLYVQEVSGGFEIASLTENFSAYKFTKDQPLLLEWGAFSDTQVQVRASSLRRKLYFRMDTLRAEKSSSYVWPTDILSRLELGRDEIGLLAWTEPSSARGKRRIYLPLRVTPQPSSTNSQPEAADSYKIALVSSVELQEVYVTLCPLDSSGNPGQPIRKNSKLDYGFYPAERPITFRISFSELSGAAEGLYSLSIGAELKNGDPKIMPAICFLHKADPNGRAKSGGGTP